MIWRPFMPKALRTPISRVRSKTAISIRLSTPMLAIISTIKPRMVVNDPFMASVSSTSGCSVVHESTS